jgi:hypothetical protein
MAGLKVSFRNTHDWNRALLRFERSRGFLSGSKCFIAAPEGSDAGEFSSLAVRQQTWLDILAGAHDYKRASWFFRQSKTHH